MILNKPKAIIFDLGNTIIKMKEADYFNGINALIKEFKIKIKDIAQLKCNFSEYDKEIIRLCKNNHFQISFENYINIFFKNNKLPLIKDINKAEKIFRANVYPEYEFEKDVFQFIDLLKEKNIEVGILSNHLFSGEGIYHDIKQKVSIDWVISSADYGITKPHIFLFQIALSNRDYTASEVIFIGDSLENDILGCQGYGMRGIWYNPQYKNNDTDIIPFMEINNYQTIIDTFKNM